MDSVADDQLERLLPMSADQYTGRVQRLVGQLETDPIELVDMPMPVRERVHEDLEVSEGMLEVLIEDLNPVSGAQSDMRSEHPDPRRLAHRTVSPAWEGSESSPGCVRAKDGADSSVHPARWMASRVQRSHTEPTSGVDKSTRHGCRSGKVWSPACQDACQCSTYPTSTGQSTVLKAPCDTSDTGRVRGGGERVGCKR